MRFEQLVDKKTQNDLKQLCNIHSNQKKQHEHLSKRDLRELMGENRDRYRKVRGAWRTSKR